MNAGYLKEKCCGFWRNATPETRLVIGVLLPYSLCCLALAFKYDLFDEVTAAGVDYLSYGEKFNWWGYPLFFVATLPLLHWSGYSFLHAWKSLNDTGVLKKKGLRLSPAEAGELVDYIRRWRLVFCLPLALLLPLLLMSQDMKQINAVYQQPQQDGEAVAGYNEQMEYACDNADFFVKWLFDAWAKKHSDTSVCLKPAASDTAGNTSDTRIAQAATTMQFVNPPTSQLLLKNLLYGEQFALVFIGAWVLFQLILYPLLFALFNHLPYSRSHQLTIELDSQSPLKEFGLEHWNQVLNNIYWVLSLALIAPIASRLSQINPDDPSKGQELISVWIPILLLTPMIANITARQAHLPAVWQRLVTDKSLDPTKYHEQRLWPLDRNWSSKLGIIVAFALASAFLGVKIIKEIV
ncbi:MAG: hypothetical protein COW18_13955 [Zetaproteobacteria bacterium CG12_big_fil_rev_8_21_14_0_65_54_13]|nr:MAG: hypothetical protein COW18_13955 [Zetaproteobacteria bacterium CG12_big_fil_rev_8_21_14_0_65_54_13]PIX54507.1 MAG: hypothetical protein COZ50_07630 [Zetaproteobacteria bacterium CG_4_10_14_3_um_filter_54_28]PJA28680.1 MAG: hypothetical protein CO188_08660 [Zetaproteobacteria bacterium CG_4_9_14_3_um_filter_54_145]